MPPYNKMGEIMMENDKYIDREVAEIFETIRSTFRLTVSLSAVLTTANITLLGFAFSNRSASLIFLGSFFPMVYMAFLAYAYKVFIALALSAMRLEKFAPNGALFASTVVSFVIPSTYLTLSKIIRLDEYDEQLNELRKNYVMPFTPFTHILIPLWILVQIIGSIFLWHFFDWPLVSF